MKMNTMNVRTVVWSTLREGSGDETVLLHRGHDRRGFAEVFDVQERVGERRLAERIFRLAPVVAQS